MNDVASEPYDPYHYFLQISPDPISEFIREISPRHLLYLCYISPIKAEKLLTILRGKLWISFNAKLGRF